MMFDLIDREGSQVISSQYEDEDTTFYKKYGKKEAGASYSFGSARK
jgi:hypothetical protein